MSLSSLLRLGAVRAHLLDCAVGSLPGALWSGLRLDLHGQCSSSDPEWLWKAWTSCSLPPHPQPFSQKAPPLILPIHRAQGAMGSSHASIPPQVHPVPEGSPSLSGHRPHLSVGTSWVSLGFPPHTLVRPGAAQLAAEPAEDEGGVCMLLEASSLGARQRLRP